MKRCSSTVTGILSAAIFIRAAWGILGYDYAEARLRRDHMLVGPALQGEFRP